MLLALYCVAAVDRRCIRLLCCSSRRSRFYLYTRVFTIRFCSVRLLQHSPCNVAFVKRMPIVVAAVVAKPYNSMGFPSIVTYAVASKSMSKHVIARAVLFSSIVMRYIRKSLGTMQCVNGYMVDVLIDRLVLIKSRVSINSRMASMQFLVVYKIVWYIPTMIIFCFVLHNADRRHMPQCLDTREKERVQLFLIKQKMIK